MLRVVALISGIYDVSLGAAMLVASDALAAWFGLPPASPPVLAGTNALFLIAVGLGYALPFRDPETYRPYLWLMGPFLKGSGAALFIYDVIARSSPVAFLLFAVTDGSLAAATWWALRRDRAIRRASAAPATPVTHA
jgi:hypothetical protein